MLRFIFAARYMNLIAVLSLLVGMGVTLLLGAFHIYEALHSIFAPADPDTHVNVTVVFVLEALDSFILSFILLYFAYSVYFLFLAAEEGQTDTTRNAVPTWLRVQSLAEMKKTLLQVIVVALSLFWLRIVMIHTDEAFQWTDLVLPASILSIAGAIRMMDLNND